MVEKLGDEDFLVEEFFEGFGEGWVGLVLVLGGDGGEFEFDCG